MGGKNGIGFYLTQAQSLFDVAGMFSALVILGVLGNLINWLYVRVETRQLHRGAHL